LFKFLYTRISNHQYVATIDSNIYNFRDLISIEERKENLVIMNTHPITHFVDLLEKSGITSLTSMELERMFDEHLEPYQEVLSQNKVYPYYVKLYFTGQLSKLEYKNLFQIA
jgi:hypothetical protein